jgi:hypothetical protein
MTTDDLLNELEPTFVANVEGLRLIVSSGPARVWEYCVLGASLPRKIEEIEGQSP